MNKQHDPYDEKVDAILDLETILLLNMNKLQCTFANDFYGLDKELSNWIDENIRKKENIDLITQELNSFIVALKMLKKQSSELRQNIDKALGSI